MAVIQRSLSLKRNKCGSSPTSRVPGLIVRILQNHSGTHINLLFVQVSSLNATSTRDTRQFILKLSYCFCTDNQTDGVWLGGADLLVENEWVWVKQGRPFTYTRWAPREPSHYHRVGADENCLDLLPHKSFMWNDESCAWKMNFLCKTR